MQCPEPPFSSPVSRFVLCMPTASNTKYAKLGDMGSQVLPKYDTGTVWEAGSTVETMASFRAVHGGGYQYR